MWIKEHELAGLRARIDMLENRLNALGAVQAHSPEEIVYYPGGVYFGPQDRKKVAVQTVVLQILKHLGLALEHDPGVEPHTKLVKNPKPKKLTV